MFFKLFKVSVNALIGIIFLGVGGYGYAQEKLNLTFNSVAQSGPHDFVYSIHMDGSNGIAVGGYGLILRTNDGGSTWSKSAFPTKSNGLFSGVTKSGKCIAAGQSGWIISSEDCKSWVQAKPITNERILSVDLNSKGYAVAVGGFGLLMQSFDWGKSWEKITVDWTKVIDDPAEPHLYKVIVSDSGVVTIAGEFELIMQSTDQGKKWKGLHKGTRSLFGMAITPSGQIIAVGQEGLILKSDAQKGNWAVINSKITNLLTDISVNSDGQIAYIAGMRILLKSTDGGKSFSQIQNNKISQNIFSSLSLADTKLSSKSFLVGGAAGQIFKVNF
jgi:photosystem II stability/assembly factor-like uncharacterized protein